MNKKYILIMFALVVLFLSACGQSQSEKLIEYLENKYEKEFTIVSVAEDKAEDVVYAYNVSPKDNVNIVFIAGQEKSQSNIMPFVPPVKEKVFFDNYFEITKQSIIDEKSKDFGVSEFSDLTLVASDIYALMENINNELEKSGFSITKYTPSLSLNVDFNGTSKNIEFYIMDESVIYGLLSKGYEE